MASTGQEFLDCSQHHKDLLVLLQGSTPKSRSSPTEKKFRELTQDRLFQGPGHAVLISGPGCDSSLLLEWVLVSQVKAPEKAECVAMGAVYPKLSKAQKWK